ncbi:MAG: hypothetical protein LRZ88_05225 [Candidatus Cloacimonetes bacterium]|nr:hypothetical protein [Candidatus Cloacimonadota bacterium]
MSSWKLLFMSLNRQHGFKARPALKGFLEEAMDGIERSRISPREAVDRAAKKFAEYIEAEKK